MHSFRFLTTPREPGPGKRGLPQGADGLRSRGEGRTTNNSGGPRPRTKNHQGDEGREPAVPITMGALIASDRCEEDRA